MLDEDRMENEKIVQEQGVWLAIRYLDPDEKNDAARHRGTHKASMDNVATAILALLLIVALFGPLFWLLGP
jgi:hypothetical protein